MGNNTLDPADRAVLAALQEGPASAAVIRERLPAAQETPPDGLAASLGRLRENALVREVDEGRFELTDNGVRLLNATGDGDRDERIDTPPAVEDAIESQTQTPPEAEALRRAFSFLQFWGDATTAEIVDATYSEAPAGYGDADRWWSDCIGDRLGSLPRVTGTPDAGPSALWVFQGTALAEHDGDSDGRAVVDRTDAPERSGSVRHGIEEATRDGAERSAARAAFAALFSRGAATSRELVEAVTHLEDSRETVDLEVKHGGPDGSIVVEYPPGFASAADWAERLTEILEVLPGVDREWRSADTGEAVWTYRPDGGRRDERTRRR